MRSTTSFPPSAGLITSRPGPSPRNSGSTSSLCVVALNKQGALSGASVSIWGWDFVNPCKTCGDRAEEYTGLVELKKSPFKTAHLFPFGGLFVYSVRRETYGLLCACQPLLIAECSAADHATIERRHGGTPSAHNPIRDP
jgi:hypothetical protein